MSEMTISISEKMCNYVKDRIATGPYVNTSEFFRDLIRKDQSWETATQELRGIMERAETSGISSRTDDDIFNETVAEIKSKGLLRD